MISEMNPTDRIEFNKISVRAKIDDKTMPYLKDKSFGFDFCYEGKLPPISKDEMLKQLDGRWEQIKAEIVKQLYGE